MDARVYFNEFTSNVSSKRTTGNANGFILLSPSPRAVLCFCSFYNWTTRSSTSNSSSNFEVVYDDPGGLLFRSKRDKKLLNVDPSVRLWLHLHRGVCRCGVFDVTSPIRSQ